MMSRTLLSLCLASLLPSVVFGQERRMVRKRELAAMEYLARAEKLLDQYYNVRGTATTLEERRAFANRAFAKLSKNGADDAALGILLLTELFKRGQGDNKTPPFWAIAGLHHHVLYQDSGAIGGIPVGYARLLLSRGVVPEIGQLVALDGKRIPSGCLRLYSELCFIALKGVRSKSPVAMKKLVNSDVGTGPELKSVLNMAETGSLQAWYKETVEKVAAERLWSGKKTLEFFSQAIVGLTPGSKSNDLPERVASLPPAKPEETKAFLSDLLKLQAKAPVTMRPAIDCLTKELLTETYDSKRWKIALVRCWQTLVAEDKTWRNMQGRLDDMDIKNRISSLQVAVDVHARPSMTTSEKRFLQAMRRSETLKE